eukprot:SAG31_NODE_14384_length_810_cov_0.849508_1_plen_22_part_10
MDELARQNLAAKSAAPANVLRF